MAIPDGAYPAAKRAGPRPSLGVVIVSFNTKDLVDRCLTSLEAELARAGLTAVAQIWVVDNASSDGSADLVRERHPSVRLTALDTNVGFTAANNVVLNAWAYDLDQASFDGDRTSDPAFPDLVLLLNPDTEIRPGALTTLIAALEADPLVAIVGPRLVYPDGRAQTSAFRLPGLGQTALDLWPVPRLMESTLNGRYPAAQYASGRPFEVEAILGACMLVRGVALRHVGPVDEGFFMYCEELDWCRRFADAGYRILCVPAAIVVHHGGASTSQAGFRSQSFAHLWRSRRRYFAKHGSWLVRNMVDLVIRLAFWLRAAGDRRDVAAGRLSAAERDERAGAYAAVLAEPDRIKGTDPVHQSGGNLHHTKWGLSPFSSAPAEPGPPATSVERTASAAADVTAVVLAYNEERHLPDTLASLRWCGRVIVVDSGSTDGTVDLARRAGAEVISHPFVNYSQQRQFALGLAATPWLLFIDSDETVPPALADEIRRTIATAPDYVGGYWLPRENDFWGQRMRGGGWWPDYQLRLLRPERARYDPARAVHEVAEVEGRTGKLSVPFLHRNYASFAEFRAKQVAYARHEADKRLAAGMGVRPHNFLLQPLREFWRRYVTLGGWRDGRLGLVVCAWMGWTELRALWLVSRAAAGQPA